MDHPTVKPENMTETVPEVDEAEYHFEKFLNALNIDIDGDEHLQDTPRRVKEAYRDELFRGLNEDPTKHLGTTFEDVEQSSGDAGLVIVDGIQVQSMCAHHLLPFRGEAHIGYIPRDKVVGLSKLSRVTQGFARRPQVQERLTNQIANAVHDNLQPKATIVYIKAEHECMTLRGVQEPNSLTRTTALRGEARENDHIKQEFFDMVSDDT